MERRAFGYVAAMALLPGCSSTVTDDPTGDDKGDDDTTSQERSDIPGLGSDGMEDVDAFLDAQREALESAAHTFSFTQTAEETFEDGFKAGELRAEYDPNAQQLYLRRWWRYPDGDRSGMTQLYADDSDAGKRTVQSEGEVRLEPISASSARERYLALRENVRDLLARLTFGPLEEGSADDGASYRLPITGVRDTGDEGIQRLDSGHVSVAENGLLTALEIDGMVTVHSSERTSDLTAEVTAVGETTVSEPDWFGDVPEQVDSGSDGGTDGGEGGSDGTVDGGSDGTVDRTTTSTTERTTERTTISGDHETIVVGPDGDNVFRPETLRITPGETVLWVWDSDTHNVKPDDQPAGADWAGHPEIVGEGTTYEHTFEVEGRYEYVCEPHVAVGMQGEIIVEPE